MPEVKAAEVVIYQVPIDKVLEEPFLAIDNIIAEAFTYSHKQATSVGTNKRFCAESEKGKDKTIENMAKRDIFTATLFLPLQRIGNAISSYGMQLLPAVHEISRRLLTLVSSSMLACAEAWEMCARLCLYYGVGAVPVLREVVDFVLREPGVLLLDCPCFVLPELMEYLLLSMSPPPSNKIKNSTGTPLLSPATHRLSRSQQDMDAVLEQTERKLRSLRLMIAAAGDALNPASLQQFALRFSQEIIQDGILNLSSQAGDVAFTAIQAFQHHRAATGGTTVVSQNPIHWKIPSEWKAECVLLLDTLLAALRPVDMELLRSATLLVQTLYASTQRGMMLVPNHQLHSYQECVGETLSYPEVGASTLAAVTQLERTLLLLRHPPLLPAKSVPATIVVEQRQRRIFVEPELSDSSPSSLSPPTCPSQAGESSLSLTGTLFSTEMERTTPVLPSMPSGPTLEKKADLLSAPSTLLTTSSSQGVLGVSAVKNKVQDPISLSIPTTGSSLNVLLTPTSVTPGEGKKVPGSSDYRELNTSLPSDISRGSAHEDDDLPDIDLED